MRATMYLALKKIIKIERVEYLNPKLISKGSFGLRKSKVE